MRRHAASLVLVPAASASGLAKESLMAIVNQLTSCGFRFSRKHRASSECKPHCKTHSSGNRRSQVNRVGITNRWMNQ